MIEVLLYERRKGLGEESGDQSAARLGKELLPEHEHHTYFILEFNL